MEPFPFGRACRAALAACASAVLLSIAAAADVARPEPAAPATVPSRGALLYDTHCIECHTAQVHWRDRQRARDWATLKAEVLRWQEAARLAWTEAEVDAVTDHLNEAIYRFDTPRKQAREATGGVGRISGPAQPTLAGQRLID